MLRTEGGMRLIENFSVKWGKIVLTEKGSYINQTPFFNSSPSAVFIGSASVFSITTGTLSVQNLGAFEFSCAFLPTHPKVPNFTFDFQGEWGSKMQSYFASLQIGKDF